MRSLILLKLIFLLTLVASGCANIDKRIDTIKPTAVLLGTRLTNINFEQADLVFDVAVKNQNPFSLRMTGLDYELMVADQSLISGVIAQGLKLKKSSTSKVALPLTLKFDDLKKLPGKLWESDQFTYQLASTIHLDLPVIGRYSIPFTKKGELPVPKIPSIHLKKLKVNKLNLTSADVVASIEVDNPNAFKLGLKNFDYKLNINQQTWGQGTDSTANSIPEKSRGILNIPLKLNLLTMGKSVYRILNGDQRLNYQLSGGITLDTGLNFLRAYKMPLNISGSTSLK